MRHKITWSDVGLSPINAIMSAPPPTPPPDDMLAALLAAAPPRSVPPALVLLAQQQAYSPGLIVLGFFLLAVGLVSGWFMFPSGIGLDWQLNGGPTEHTTGEVTYASATGANVGASRSRSGTPVYAYYFTFIPAGGTEMSGVSYTTGLRPWQGADVDIEYLVADPTVARIAGSRTSQRTWAGPFPMAILTILGLFNLGLGWRAHPEAP
jgi:hypothetical protein